MSEPLVVVYDNATVLAQAVAARIIVGLVDAQARRGEAGIVLTGGRIAMKIHEAVRDSPARDAVDWGRVDFYWGDERYLPDGDPDRNETQARQAMLDALPVDPARVHPMAADDGTPPEEAARRYAETVEGAVFDVLMLGVGEDGHVASIFPGHDEGLRPGAVAAVHNSPKPPPTRLTLTVDRINSAAQVWLVASGDGKADAVGAALNGEKLPCASVHGTEATVWLLDRDAASKR